ncbi:MAG: type II secretion system F family protein [Deltaproteobacteria bacterium CG_4_10_14_0_2_um_filter_43_8]|nr:MAG: general secretion pathway protein GspF [Deltaproteobacteria bacterium CG11_big_fil_rev_8_21_14_0_20_42_23]PJA18150.1 MAG: type II secretion system F family protein [Deltaproteobacteria bacterium CG_4_10_14_0_2_um_filter_43_8]PJC64261.1 MAG: type II secretion system F family protein [Deltaproteobacteria bacterium CG_4_9_14_0_2_um_filter_42_21]
MPMYHYRARDKKGTLITGEIEANSPDELKESLFAQNCIPLKVHEIRSGQINFESVKGFFNRVRPEELMVFTRQFQTLFKAGVSMDTILSTMGQQVKSVALANALNRIRADIAAGASLSQSFSRHPKVFNELYTSMLAAGEEAGILEKVLKNLSNLLDREFTIQKNIKSATLYPKIVVFVLVCAVAFLMTFVIPKFAEFYSHYGADLPLPTRMLIAISNFVMNYWYIAIAGVVGIVYLYKRFYSTHTGRMKIDKMQFNLPVFGPLNLKVANSRFGHIMAALYSSGLSMPRCLDVVANVIGNAAFALEVKKIRDDISRGSTLSEGMRSRSYFPLVMIETTSVGEKAGALDEMLSTIAEHYDIEIDHTVKNLTTLLEPIMLVGIFGMVILLALAILLPMWSLATVVK